MARKLITPLLFTFVLAAFLVFGGATNTRADSITRQELSNFDHFLNNHSKIARDLRSNPNLVNDPRYLRDHPDLREFLSNHHGVRDELRTNPGRFLARGGWYQGPSSYGRYGRGGWNQYDAWSEGHRYSSPRGPH
jgi:hypothetical protein